MRERVEPLISLVAVADKQVVGHVLFSPVTVGNGLVTLELSEEWT